jgi:quercetin dioxygenase-like cupin family protein
MRSLVAVIGILAVVAGVSAQQAGFSRTVIQRGDLSTPGREVVSAIAEFQPSATVGPHTHPGEEAGYLLEGTLVFEQAGKPTVTLKAGETFFVPAGTVHNATNKGSARTRVLATYIVEKGKPLATPSK